MTIVTSVGPLCSASFVGFEAFAKPGAEICRCTWICRHRHMGCKWRLRPFGAACFHHAPTGTFWFLACCAVMREISDVKAPAIWARNAGWFQVFPSLHRAFQVYIELSQFTYGLPHISIAASSAISSCFPWFSLIERLPSLPAVLDLEFWNHSHLPDIPSTSKSWNWLGGDETGIRLSSLPATYWSGSLPSLWWESFRMSSHSTATKAVTSSTRKLLYVHIDRVPALNVTVPRWHYHDSPCLQLHSSFFRSSSAPSQSTCWLSTSFSHISGSWLLHSPPTIIHTRIVRCWKPWRHSATLHCMWSQPPIARSAC